MREDTSEAVKSEDAFTALKPYQDKFPTFNFDARVISEELDIVGHNLNIAENVRVVTNKGEEYPIGNVEVLWDGALPVSNVLGGIGGLLMPAVIPAAGKLALLGITRLARFAAAQPEQTHTPSSSESTQEQSSAEKTRVLTRRSFVKIATFVSAALAGALYAPDVVEEAAQIIMSDSTRRAALGSRFVYQGEKYLHKVGNLHGRIETGELAPDRTEMDPDGQPLFSVETMKIKGSRKDGDKVEDTVYVVTPRSSKDAKLQFHTALHTGTNYIKGNKRYICTSALPTEFAAAVGQTMPGKTNIVLGHGEEIDATKLNVVTMPTHTIANALSISISDSANRERTFLTTSCTWSQPLSIAYSQTTQATHEDGRPLTPTEWLCLSTKTFTWSPDMFSYWQTEELLTHIRDPKNLEIWRSKAVDDYWTEGVPDHPGFHRSIIIENGVTRVVSDKEAWEDFRHRLFNNPASLKTVSYARPGMILDPADDTDGDFLGDMPGVAINGIILGKNGEVICAVTLNQNTRMTSKQMMDLAKDIAQKKGVQNDEFHFLVTDMHGAGGLVVNAEQVQNKKGSKEEQAQKSGERVADPSKRRLMRMLASR